jgi:6-pyruvoyltetrahydropterin/6-carboxytetrahydropterin synthase
LNEVDGLSTPTLERIATWLWDRLSSKVPGLAEIQVMRESCHEGVIYSGPERPARLAQIKRD